MNNTEEVMQAISIGLVVASFLVYTGRGFKAIELLEECLILLNFTIIPGIEERLAETLYYDVSHRHIFFRTVQRTVENWLADTYKIVAHTCCDQDNYAIAKEVIMKALAIDIKNGNKNGEAVDYACLGRCFQSLGQYCEAIQYNEKALAIVIESSNRNVEAVIYGNLGVVFCLLGKYDQAKIYHEKALTIRKEIGDKKGEGNDYANLGCVFHSLGKYFQAEKLFEKALEIRMKIGDRRGESSSYENLGSVFLHVGEYVKAKTYLDKALVIQIEIGDRLGQAESYVNLGSVFKAVGNYSKAKGYLKKALVIGREVQNRRVEVASSEILGNTYFALGEYTKAKQYYEKALTISMEIGDRAREQSCQGNLGNVFQSQGKYDKAKEYFEKALTIAIEIGDRRGETINYGNLAMMFLSVGKYVKAQEYHEKALAISKKMGDRKIDADIYGNVGCMFKYLNENVKAKEYYEKALTIRVDIGDRAGEALDYGNLGVVFQSLGENVRAKEYFDKALVIRKEIGDKNGEAVSYENLGTMFLTFGEHAKAQTYFGKSLDIFKEIGNKAGEAASYGGLGTVCQVLGEYVMAVKYLEEALSIAKDIGDSEKEGSLHCFLALVKLLQGKIQEASSNLFEGIKKCENLRHYLSGDDQLNISFSDAHVFPYQLLSKLFCAAGNSKEAVYVVELGRARGLADLMTTQYSVKMEISANPESWVGIENIMNKESNCTCLYISYNDQNIYFWILKVSGVIHFRQKKVNRNMAHDRLIKNLDDFFSNSFRSFGILSEGECEDRSLKDIQPNLKSSLEESLATLRLVEDDDEESPGPEPSLSLYYKLLIAPVVDLLQDREIIIVPDRSVYRVPFAALHDGRGRYLSETFWIRIVPSLTTLKLIQDSPADYHSQTGALIVGDPNVGQVLYKGVLQNISRLPCARKEAVMIGRLLGVQPLLAEHATKHAVLQRINSVGLIHFAAHGNAERGEIALTPQGTSSGFPEEDDYLLTMSDISQVQLRAKLVVLSCCHSGNGQIRTEGVVGIARAFLGSGARSVLVALWAIEDTATEQFMRLFYEHLVRGESASECLHEAMKWMRGNGYSDVTQWAPFMLIGDNVTLKFGK